jgi:hypothetical protein
MTDQPTPRLALPMLQPGQAQKEMFHNEALARLDFAVQCCVVATGANIPPDDPEPGAAWIVGTTPAGAWAGRAKAIAGWTPGGWRFIDAFDGLSTWIVEDEEFAVFFGGAWRVGKAYGRLIVDGEQVVGPRADAIEDPDGGSTVDVEARAALVSILAALREHGLIEAL